jgi:hypothetical protein
LGQEIGNAHYRDAAEAAKRQKVSVAAYHHIRSGGNGAFENFVVRGICLDDVQRLRGRDVRGDRTQKRPGFLDLRRGPSEFRASQDAQRLGQDIIGELQFNLAVLREG